MLTISIHYEVVENEKEQARRTGDQPNPAEIYEKTKDLTPEQYTRRVRELDEAAAKKYGFERVASANGKTE